MSDDTKRLYYYTGPRWGMKSLWERRLKIARYQDLNDPFELLPFDLSDTKPRTFWEAEVHRLVSAEHGVICFSDRWQTNVMWSQYAERHTGLCLGFDVPAELARPVRYVAQRLREPADPERALKGAPIDVLEAALGHKHTAWRHEREWRVRARLAEATGGVFYKRFDDALHLREVIVGARCSTSIEEVEAAVSSPPMDVEIFHAQAAHGSFEICRHLEAAPRTIKGYRARLARARDLYADELPDDEESAQPGPTAEPTAG